MARHRTRVRVSRSLRVVAVALLATASTTVLFEADIGRSLLLSSTMVAGAPPLLYVLLAFVLLRGAPLDRRLGWAVGACGVYAALGLASGVVLSLAHPMSLEGALRRSLWSFAPAPIVHLLAAPLILLAWRSRVTPGRLIGRERDAFTLFPRRSGSAPSPDWDSVLHASPPAPKASGPASPVPERVGRARDAAPVARAPQERTPTAIVAAVPEVASPLVAAPASATAAPSPMVAAPSSRMAPPRPVPGAPAPPTPATARVVPAPTPRTPPPASLPPRTTSTPAATEGPVASQQEPVIRIPFDRVADQLPPDVFTLPPARLAEILQEPHVLLVPSRLVLPQLGEGAVEVSWTLVDGQFPELAFAMPQAEVRRRFPGWVLSLPMDVVVRQIPRDLLLLQGPAPDLSSIGDFPAPFTPGPPQPEDTTASDSRPPADSKPAAVPPPPVATPPPASPSVSKRGAPPAPGPSAAIAKPVAAPPAPIAPRQDVAIDIPEVLFAPEASPAPKAVTPAPTAPPAPAAPSAAAKPTPSRAPVAAPMPKIAVKPAGPAGTTVAAPRAATATPAPVSDEAGEALARTLAPGLAPLGAFDWHARRVGGRPLLTFVPPALTREPIERLTAGAAPLVQRLESWGMEQMTIRTDHLACVFTPLGARGCLAATVRRGGSIAMLELLSARAVRAAGGVANAIASPIAFPEVGTVPATEDAGHRSVAEAARALAAFGPVAASVAEAEGTAPDVYVFADHDQSVLAGAARAVYDTLVPAHDQEALGRLESVVLRRGRERVVVRPLGGPTGAPAVLATAGEVVMAGRAHRAAAQAAAALETR
jgi:hypothetical protein